MSGIGTSASNSNDEATVESEAITNLPIIETSQPPPRHLRQQNSARSMNSTGSAAAIADATKKARLTTLPPATKPGISYVREQLAATESGAISAVTMSEKIDAKPSLDTLVTASTESYDEYVARKRRMNTHLADLENYGSNDEEDAEAEAEVDPYAHLRNQPRRPKTIPVAYEVEATPVFDDDDDGKRRRNPLKDWRVLVFLAVALSAVVGLTVALLMQNNNSGGNDGTTSVGSASQQTGGGIDGSIGQSRPTSEPTPSSLPIFPEVIPEEPVDTDNESVSGGVVRITLEPTRAPTLSPTRKPIAVETNSPTPIVTMVEVETTSRPTPSPTFNPTQRPSKAPVSPAPTDAPVSPAPTDAPVSPVPTDAPATSSPSSSPVVSSSSPVTTKPPTSSPVAAVDITPPPYKIQPFTMTLLTSTQIDQNKLVAATSSHLIPFVQDAVPNLLTMSLSVDLSAPGNKRRSLRSYESRDLQLQFATYTATYSGEIQLDDDTFVPTENTLKTILSKAFSGENLDAFILDELWANARVTVGAIVIRDVDGDTVGQSKTYSPVTGSLQTPLTNRFTRAGVMFDITATHFPVKITRLSIHTSTTDANVPVEVWIKAGSYVGHERDEGAWTSPNNGQPYIVSQGMGLGKLTAIPEDQFESLTIPAGQTIGVYITLSEGRELLLGQTSQLGEGKTKNSLLEIQSGSSVDYRFGAVNPGKTWGGSIRYELEKE